MTDPDPFSEIEELFDQFAQLGEPLAGRFELDVIDADSEILVKADLPGRDPSALSVQLEENRTLRIEVPEGETSEDGRFVVRERTRESGSRSVTLPAAVDESETEASYDRGVLTVRLPKLSGDGDETEIQVN
ncbi:Hsp20 family protein [Halovenus sp. WSH3]|uniref:Hsp20 family protein n=1 Tax=Halovenus carboxidivorans TaxID=2692199 RepID=A0A6B0T833_9EURY|nr:Hsp20/alpha crystallin family protein [Halovenus carboxidivorans]MXR51462.1 Hsp20 family protein [Halovenus carboxidivorans]